MSRDLLLFRLASTFTAIAAVGSLGILGACDSSPDDEDDTGPRSQEELQALLHDDPLNDLPPGSSARVAEAAADKPTASFVPPGANPVGAWSFDDCNPSRTNLFDSFAGNTAFRSVGVACTTGVQNTQAVAIAAKEDLVYVPDQPNFTFEGGLTVAGWFNPTAAGNNKTLFRKRDKDTSSFALMLNSGKFELILSLGDNRAISLTSPRKAKVGVFQHVAATYDGNTARLYVDGLEVTSFTVPGTIPPGPGPLLMGNDGSERRFAGAIDSTLFATHALTADQVLALTCVPAAPSVVFGNLAATPAGTPAILDLALTNNSPAVCGASAFEITTFPASGGLTLDPPPFFTVQSPPVAPGATIHFPITATPDSDQSGNTLFFDVQVNDPLSQQSFFDFFSLEVTDASGCQISTSHELMIKSTSVVDDPVRTTFNPGSMDPRNGVWTFKHLVENMAPTPADAPAMIENILSGVTTSQTINGFSIAGRSGFQRLVLDAWPRTATGALDLAKPPLRLQAIVNRFDLRNLAQGNGGEGRFVFAFESGGRPLQATMIFEYKLPASSDAEVLDWATSFHALGGLAFGEDYNAALQAITERFVGRGVRPDHPNGSAINAVRTNEIDLGDNGIWELREFHLSPVSGLLQESPLELTPDRSFDNSSTLAQYIMQNQAQIIAETHTVPAQFNGQPFQAGAVFNDLSTWFAPGSDPEARHHFALNTCNGCHSSQETGVGFLQISPRFPGNEASLSGFLTGTTIPDPVTLVPRAFNDLGRRRDDLKAIVCADGLRAVSPAQLRKGISRVH
jgi:hypothetical protein